MLLHVRGEARVVLRMDPRAVVIPLAEDGHGSSAADDMVGLVITYADTQMSDFGRTRRNVQELFPDSARFVMGYRPAGRTTVDILVEVPCEPQSTLGILMRLHHWDVQKAGLVPRLIGSSGHEFAGEVSLHRGAEQLKEFRLLCAQWEALLQSNGSCWVRPAGLVT